MTMRKILFRGKEIGADRWVHGSLDIHKSGVVVIMTEEIVTSIYARVDPTTVGQYTGIDDKAGIPIYEDDIIRAVLPGTVAFREYVWPLMAVAFHEGAFGVWQSQREFFPLQSFASRVEFTVVGNIHDNPDMLEVRNG